MPPALGPNIKEQVRRLWFSGETRRNIAEVCGTGAGSVTNIIKELTKDLDSSEYGATRDLAVHLKREGLTFAELASIRRRHNYIEKLGANEEEVESLIANLVDKTKSIPIEKTVDSVNQLYKLSNSESIPPSEVPTYIDQKINEKKRLEEEIQKGREILDQENVDIRTIEEYKRLKEELKKFGLSTEAPNKLLSALRSFRETEYDPQKIVTNYLRIKSLRQTVRGLGKECRMLESRAARYKEILPLCEQIDSIGIGFPELVAFRSALFRIAEMENLSYGEAAYILMARIDTPGKIADMDKQIKDKMMKIQMVNLVSAHQNAAVIALAKLQYYGITDNQILNLCKIIESNGHNLIGAQSTNPHSFYTF